MLIQSLVSSRKRVLMCAVVGVLSQGAQAAPAVAAEVSEVIVTASRVDEPLVVVTDPRKPRQPVPAQDGADYLKTIPGFNVIRKGGTDGDPVLRGMAASRLGIALDGAQVLGGCGMRMDPPTAYVFPGNYDRIVVVKGPQAVVNGPGLSAGSVSFERELVSFDHDDLLLGGSALGATAGRNDLNGQLLAGTPDGYFRLQGTRTESGDYRDGHGQAVHGAYRRWSGDAAMGWTPDRHTQVEWSLARSDGEAAYADRAMDGVKFDRTANALRLRRQELPGAIKAMDFMVYQQAVDHVMDNYSLRTFVPSTMMANLSVSNPDRLTRGGRALLEFAPLAGITVKTGLDGQLNVHRLRSTMNQNLSPYQNSARREDARFRQFGWFAEARVPTGEKSRLISGARVDWWEAEDHRATVSLGMMGAMPNPTAGQQRRRQLVSGFSRYEQVLSGGAVTAYAGIGHSERFPDYWELFNKESATTLSAFRMAPERTTQLDAGLLGSTGRWSWSVSGFAGRVDDYLLVRSAFAKGARQATIVRNVDASTWGGEADVQWRSENGWKLVGTMAYTQGRNRTDDRALGQQPPLEMRLAADRSYGSWQWGVLVRNVARQGRFALNEGNIVGQDLGATAGFTVVSANAAWHMPGGLRVSAGVDNLLDRAYAEHLSRGGAMLAGYDAVTRVPEPGRTAWLRVEMGRR